MGILFLVRHAQASLLEQNYDKLSALGEAQACHLGEYWARRQIVFDRVCAGPCVRQKDHDGIHVAVDHCPGCGKPWDEHTAAGDGWDCPSGGHVSEAMGWYNPAGLVQFA